ncbi:MAG TPA: hypothetical protein PKX87_03335, partial [Alphaproteobacteria bacterium]|nr:hypothetical protein [Alphaproteobacteria bacterium]
MPSLAQEFGRRFREDFPEYSQNVFFLETLPKDSPHANMGPLARLKDLFRVKAHSPDILLFDRLRRDLSTLPAEHLQTLCEQVIEGRFGMYLFSPREMPLNFFRFEDPDTAAPLPALCVVIGPDRSRTINDLLSCTALNQTGMDFPKLLHRSAADLLPGLFR